MNHLAGAGKLGIVGSPEGWYVQQLLQAAERELGGDRVQVVEYMDLQAGLDSRGRLTSPCLQFDALLVRSMPLGSLEQVIFRMNCLHALQGAGVRVVNSPRSLEIAIDKWLTLDRLRMAGIAVPATRVVQTRSDALAAWRELGGDVVVKPLFGGEGRGLLRVTDPDMAWRVFSTLQQLRSVMYVQEFVPHLGYDVRILLIGEVAYAIRRCVPAEGWRANLAQGGRAERYQAESCEIEMARRCGRAVGAEIVGVDLLPGADGRVRVLEVNAVPGWRGIQEAWKVDVAREVVQHSMAQARKVG
ncbi:MAG: RimK family alpha-L-glutamate ligase [Planctomycetota bacterium]|nr:MAG: RimK family alpha-L-glutamate ligase [Planctomycetota bacterium]